MIPRPPSLPRAPGKAQRGAYLVIMAVAMAVLIGFVGLAVDLARQMAVHAELQSATDACALAAAVELNGLPKASERATAAGKFVGGQNRMNFQAEPVVIDEVSFSATASGTYVANPGEVDYRYVKCTARKTGFVNHFMAVLGIARNDLSVESIATQKPAREACTLPLLVVVDATSELTGAAFNLVDTNTSAATATAPFARVRSAGLDTLPLLAQSGLCGVNEDGLSTEMPSFSPIGFGATSQELLKRDKFVQAWNSRFGLYKPLGAYTYTSDPPALPDLTGVDLSDKGAEEWLQAYKDGYEARSPANTIPTAYSAPDLMQYRASGRRVVPLPIVSRTMLNGSYTTLLDWGCFLLNSPLDPAKGSIFAQPALRFLGSASDSASHCVVLGIPGGANAIGPLVPALVQ